MKEKSLNTALFTGGMVGILLLAFAFDLLLNSLTARNATEGGLDQLLVWLFPLLQLLWMVAAISLVWLMISSGGFSRLVCVIYMVVGLLILYSTSLLFVLPLPDNFYALIQYLSPGSFLYQASGAVAAIGIFSLAMWKPASQVEPGAEEAQEPASGSVDETEEDGADPASSAGA
jgi:hypothetical protein